LTWALIRVVRSLALCGTDRSGFAAFKIPPFFGGRLGNLALTSIPGLSGYTAEWFKSRGAPVYDSALVEVYCCCLFVVGVACCLSFLGFFGIFNL